MPCFIIYRIYWYTPSTVYIVIYIWTDLSLKQRLMKPEYSVNSRSLTTHVLELFYESLFCSIAGWHRQREGRRLTTTPPSQNCLTHPHATKSSNNTICYTHDPVLFHTHTHTHTVFFKHQVSPLWWLRFLLFYRDRRLVIGMIVHFHLEMNHHEHWSLWSTQLWSSTLLTWRPWVIT